MSIKVPNVGETLLLEYLRAYLNTLKLRLFKNDYTPVDGSVIGDFTEADFTGYASQNLNDFATAAQNGFGQAETDAPVHVFTQTGTGTTCTVYGYYVTDGATQVVYAERNPLGGTLMNAAGLIYPVLPRFTFETKN